MQNLLFVDIETTGLSPEDDKILEIALVATCHELVEIDSYSAVIKPQRQQPAKMNAFVTEMHTKSGLIAELDTGLTKFQAMQGAIDFIQRHGFDRPVIAGNSVHFDKEFIRIKMPELNAKLHYRLMDVSGLASVLWHLYGYEYKHTSEAKHRALDDCRASIAQLKEMKQLFVLEHLKK